MPTNAEWQAAALGTPDGAPCVVSAAGPGALLRGGFYNGGALAGVFNVIGTFPPTTSSLDIGFRAAR